MSVARSAARYAVMAARSTRDGLTATITGFTATASGASRLVSSQVFKLLRDQDTALLDCTVHHVAMGHFMVHTGLAGFFCFFIGSVCGSAVIMLTGPNFANGP